MESGCGVREKGKGIKMYKLPDVKHSHGAVKHSTRNRVNNAVLTTYGIRWILNLPG